MLNLTPNMLSTYLYLVLFPNIGDYKHLLWDCRYSVKIWKEVEQQIRTRYGVNVTLTYYNVIMGFRQEMHTNHAAMVLTQEEIPEEG